MSRPTAPPHFPLLWGTAVQLVFLTLKIHSFTCKRHLWVRLSWKLLQGYPATSQALNRQYTSPFPKITLLTLGSFHSSACRASFLFVINSIHAGIVFQCGNTLPLLPPLNLSYFRQWGGRVRQWGEIREHPCPCERLTGFLLPIPTRRPDGRGMLWGSPQRMSIQKYILCSQTLEFCTLLLFSYTSLIP